MPSTSSPSQNAFFAARNDACTLLALLVEQFPGAFRHEDEPPVPLAIGIRDQLITQLDGIASERAIRVAMKLYCFRGAYQHALAAPGAQRVNLAGELIEPVSPEDQQRAREGIAAWLAKASRRAAETGAPKPVPDGVAKTDTALKSKGMAVRPNDGAKQGKSAGNPAPKGSKSKRLNAKPNGPAKPARKVASSRAVPSTRNH